jgi:hypothetical protein
MTVKGPYGSVPLAIDYPRPPSENIIDFINILHDKNKFAKITSCKKIIYLFGNGVTQDFSIAGICAIESKGKSSLIRIYYDSDYGNVMDPIIETINEADDSYQKLLDFTIKQAIPGD